MKIGLIKVFRDMNKYKGRTLLAFIGIFIGIVAVGSVLSSYSILNREMNKNFMSTNPASIILNVPNLDARGVNLIKSTYKNIDVEVKKTALARINKGEGIYGVIYLRAIQDFNNQKVDTFTLEKGKYPNNTQELVLERDCLKILKGLKNGVGESLTINLPGADSKKIRISGIVHAPGLAPASMENYSYGFMSLDGLKNLGYQGWYDEIHIVSYNNRFDIEKINMLTKDIKKTLINGGYIVNRADVLKPGKHPHADQLSSILFLLQSFAIISLLVASVIIINLLNFIMSQQAKQIAIMKTFGARARDIVIPYLIYILIISIFAIIFSIPLSAKASEGYSNFAASILNFKITSYQVPTWVYLTQIATGIIVPILAAAYPIITNYMKCVKDGLNDNIANNVKTGISSKLARFLPFVSNSKVAIPINNLFRTKLRTILTILTIAFGGALFMISQNIVTSIDKTTNSAFESFKWDFDITLAKNYPDEKLDQLLNKINGLSTFEIWKTNTGIIKKANGIDSANFIVKAVPENSKMVKFSLMDNYKTNNSLSGVVVTKALVNEEKWIKVGSKIKLQINGKIADVEVVNIINEIPDFETIYLSDVSYKNLFGEVYNQEILASAEKRDIPEQKKININIENEFKNSKVQIAQMWNVFVLRKAFVDHLYVIITLLTLIAILAVIVGGINIASSIGINVSERKREIGILRAIGLNSRQIISMILSEVLLMSSLGWLTGVILSFPLSCLVGNYFGQIFLHSNLQNGLSVKGTFIWMIIATSLSLASAIIPAWTIAKQSLRELLAYE